MSSRLGRLLILKSRTRKLWIDPMDGTAWLRVSAVADVAAFMSQDGSLSDGSVVHYRERFDLKDRLAVLERPVGGNVIAFTQARPQVHARSTRRDASAAQHRH